MKNKILIFSLCLNLFVASAFGQSGGGQNMSGGDFAVDATVDDTVNGQIEQQNQQINQQQTQIDGLKTIVCELRPETDICQ